jgi:phosphoglycolate phosphatase
MSNLANPPIPSKLSRRFDLIAFDWDGTLFDSTQIIVRCIQEAVRDIGEPVPTAAQAAYVIGLALGPALAHVAPGLSVEKYPLLSERYKHHYSKMKDDLTLFDGVLLMLNDLRTLPYKIAVATGKSRLGLNDALKTSTLKDLFHSSRTADETAGKPDPKMLFELMEEFRVLPRRTLMVGDTSHDLLMARRAGCASVGVSYGAHPNNELERAQPLFIASSVSQLHSWIKEHG